MVLFLWELVWILPTNDTSAIYWEIYFQILFWYKFEPVCNIAYTTKINADFFGSLSELNNVAKWLHMKGRVKPHVFQSVAFVAAGRVHICTERKYGDINQFNENIWQNCIVHCCQI